MNTTTTEPTPTAGQRIMHAVLDVDLRAERARLGISRAELAAALGCSVSAIARYELGNRTPRAPVLLRIADVLTTLRRLRRPRQQRDPVLQ